MEGLHVLYIPGCMHTRTWSTLSLLVKAWYFKQDGNESQQILQLGDQLTQNFKLAEITHASQITYYELKFK